MIFFQKKAEAKNEKSLYPEEVKSSSAAGGLNFLKKIIIGFDETDINIEDD